MLSLIIGCGQRNQGAINFNELVLGDSIKKSGKAIIKHGYGLNKINYSEARSDTVFIAVHGYGSTGYEWIYPLKKMAESGIQTYFYRWDWNKCPGTAVEELKYEIDSTFSQMETKPHIIFFGHSYGGVVIALLAAQNFEYLSADFHAVAAPLSGFSRLDQICPDYRGLELLDFNNLVQWRTVQAMDGAFRDLEVDPQVIELENSIIVNLPDSVDGHRLGHNWSISWVLDAYLENELKPQIIIQTEKGQIVVEIFIKRAPISALNFLNYVDQGTFKNSFFYRTVTLSNQPLNDVKIEVIQGGLFNDDQLNLPVTHETTQKTGILHKDGVISMARLEPGTASTEFFICIGDQPALDFGGLRNPDGQGFAAFGRVIKGMDIVRNIQQLPAEKQYLIPQIQIFNIIHNQE